MASKLDKAVSKALSKSARTRKENKLKKNEDKIQELLDKVEELQEEAYNLRSELGASNTRFKTSSSYGCTDKEKIKKLKLIDILEIKDELVPIVNVKMSNSHYGDQEVKVYEHNNILFATQSYHNLNFGIMPVYWNGEIFVAWNYHNEDWEQDEYCTDAFDTYPDEDSVSYMDPDEISNWTTFGQRVGEAVQKFLDNKEADKILNEELSK